MSAFLGKEKIAPATMPEKYDPGIKVDKTIEVNKIYGTDEQGEQTIIDYGVNVTPDSIVQRSETGSVKVGAPIDEDDAVRLIDLQSIENQNGVTLDTDQTISGTKTFQDEVVIGNTDRPVEEMNDPIDACGRLRIESLGGTVKIGANEDSAVYQPIIKMVDSGGTLSIDTEGINKNNALLEYPEEGGTIATQEYVDAHAGGSGGNVTVDSELSESSENPVQNKVVTEALNGKVNKLYVDTLVGDIETALDNIIAIQNSLLGGN